MSGLPTPCAGTNNPIVTCTPSNPGLYNVSVLVTDAASNSVTATGILTVNPLPLSVTLTVNPSTITLGKTVVFTANVTGGTSPYSYSWTGLPAPVPPNTNTNVLTITPSSVGTYNVTVTLTDSRGITATANVTLTVVSALGATLSIVPNPVVVGNSVTFTVNVTGGIPPYTYNWS